MKRFIFFICLLLPLCANAGPREAVETFQQALREVSQSEATGFEQRYEQLAPVVESTHDLDYIARLTLGRYWNDLDSTDRQEFVSRFRQLAIASYAARFPQFDGEQFAIIDEQAQRRGIVLVRTELLRPDGDTLAFDYLLHETPAGWQIVNILVDGISDLALKRAEYAALLRDSGSKELLRALDQQLERLRADLK